MKYITEEAIFVDSSVQEELHENSGAKVKNYYLSGIFSTPDKKNRNGRVYPKSIWEKEVKKYQKEIQENTVNTLGEIDHPSRTNVDPLKAAIKILELKIENGNVVGKAKVLNNNSPETNQLKALIDEGIKVGVSSRGVGSVKNGIVEDFKLITYDCVSFPSDYNANLSGLSESMESKEYLINESGDIEEVKADEIDTELTEEEIKEAQSVAKEKIIALFEQIVPKSDK